MAFTCSTGSLGTPSVPATRYTAFLVATNNSYNGNTYEATISEYSQWGYSSVTENEASDGSDTGVSGSWTGGTTSNLNADVTYKYRAKVTGGLLGTKTGTTKSRKTGALAASASTPTYSAVTATTATIACNYYPNTDESTCSAQLQYKRTVDSTWTNAGTAGTTGGYSQVTSLTADLTGLTGSTSYDIRLSITRTTATGTSLTSATASFTTLASEPVATTTAATAVDHYQSTLNATVNPNGFSVTVSFEWGTTTGYGNTTTGVGYSGSSDVYPSATLTPLSAILTSGTTYHFRVKVVWSGTTVYGSDMTFDTSAAPADPTPITTAAASNIGETQATLNGILDPNGHSTTWHFEYETDANWVTDGNQFGALKVSTSDQGPSSLTYPFGITATPTGLTGATLYHFRAVAVYNSTSYYGDPATFTTETTPATGGDTEDLMQTLQFDGKTGVQKSVTFTLRQLAATNNNLYYVGDVPAKATDVFLFRDGAWVSDSIATDITRDTAGGLDALYKLTLTAGEMSTAETVDVILHSADTGARAFRDAHIQIRTKLGLGTVDVDATGITGDVDAVKLTSVGTGKGINAVDDIYTAGKIETVGNLAIGGDITTDNLTVGTAITAASMTLSGALTASSFAGVLTSMVLNTGTVAGYNGATPSVTLAAGASATADIYNGAIVGIVAGTGVGQCRTILDYAVTSKIATLDSAFAVDPTGGTYVIFPGQAFWGLKPLAELSGMPDIASATYGQLLQFLWQRFAYKRYQDSQSQKLYKADSSTVLATGTFSDNTTDQQVGKLA